VWRPSRILVGTDYSATAEQALRAAVGTARRTGAAIDLVHSVDDGAQAVTGYAVVDDLLTGAAYWKRVRERAREALDKLGREAGPPDPTTHLVRGDPAGELLALRDRWASDLVVLGGQGLRGLRRFLLGSVAERVLRRPGAPLLLVNRAPIGDTFKSVLVCVEDPGAETPWLDAGLSLAHDLVAELGLVHALPPPGRLSDGRRVELDPEHVAERIERSVVARDRAQPLKVVVRRGDPADVIPAVARELGSDLVVLGAERRPDGWPGRVADRVARAGLPAVLLIWPAA
jgi:nucleotide-binding universal stress UspA family protein